MDYLEWNGCRIKCPHCGSLRVITLENQQEKYRCRKCFEKFGGDFKADNIIKIVFESDYYLGGMENIEFELKDNTPIMNVNMPFSRYGTFEGQLQIDDWNNIKNALYNLFFINEWDNEYYDFCVFDGHHWKLSIFSDNGKTFEYSGVNAYPKLYRDMERFFKNYIEIVHKEKLKKA